MNTCGTKEGRKKSQERCKFPRDIQDIQSLNSIKEASKLFLAKIIHPINKLYVWISPFDY